MKYLILIVCIILVSGPDLFSQKSVDTVLAVVVKNNTSLSSIRKNVDADKIRNKTGIFPENPGIEFNYLWGNPSAIGNRTDLKVIQRFDFPSAYSYRNQISEIRNDQAELDYIKVLKSTLLKTKLVCFDLIYANAFSNELKHRVAYAQRIADSYKSKFNSGEANILEYNKSQLILLTLSKDYEINEIERRSLNSELTMLNGGIPVEFSETVFQTTAMPADFEQWYSQAEQNNPLLSWIRQEVLLSSKQEKLSTSLSLPKLQGGYMSEKVVGEHFQGVTVGISIPLWENKNEIKYARARTLAVQSAENDARLQFYSNLRSLHLKAVSLQNNLKDYKEKLILFSNSELLKKALDKGDISLIEYIIELSVYYESVNKYMSMEREVNKTIAELNQYN